MRKTPSKVKAVMFRDMVQFGSDPKNSLTADRAADGLPEMSLCPAGVLVQFKSRPYKDVKLVPYSNIKGIDLEKDE